MLNRRDPSLQTNNVLEIAATLFEIGQAVVQ